MANPLTTEELAGIVADVLPAIQSETSVLTRAGATSISYGTDIVSQATLGGPAAVEEGNRKPMSNVSVKPYKVVKHVLSYIFTQSEQFTDTEEGRKITASVLQQAIANLVKGFDIVVLSGTDPHTGNPFEPAELVNLKDNASQHFTTGTVATDSDIRDILASTSRVKSVILSDSGLNVVQFAESASGLRKYPDASIESSFDFWGVRAHHSETLGIDGWSDIATFDNNTIAVAGDFSKVLRSYGEPRVKQAHERIGGRDLIDNNEVGYRIEVPVSYIIKDPSSFTVLKTEEEVVPEG